MSDALVSIVIPVYNVEKYLAACLSSVVSQSYRHLEIICVNDGSTDGSFLILQEFSGYDGRIQIINQDNQGLSCARNSGAAIATGEYIYFLDSDDVIKLNLIERCVGVLADNPTVDVVTFDADIINETKQLISTNYTRENLFDNREIYSGIQFLEKESEVTKQAPVQTYFLKQKLLEKYELSFYPKIIHEDVLFHFQLLVHENVTIIYLAENLYQRRLRDNSIITTHFSEKNIKGYLQVCRELFKDKSHLKLKKRYCQPICSCFMRELFRTGYSPRFRITLIKSIASYCKITRSVPLPFYELKRVYRKHKLINKNKN